VKVWIYRGDAAPTRAARELAAAQLRAAPGQRRDGRPSSRPGGGGGSGGGGGRRRGERAGGTERRAQEPQGAGASASAEAPASSGEN
jgi:small subunit ribosomal protein S3